MSENGTETPEQVVKFEPKGRPRTSDIPIDEAGQAIIAKIQRAAELANENSFDGAQSAEDRINQLESEVQLFRERVASAEGWLQTIQKEIEEKLIAPRLAFGTEQRSLP
jgi:hypothetical protein